MKTERHLAGLTASLTLMLMLLLPCGTAAQIRIIPREKVDSISNPRLDPVAACLLFEQTVIDAGQICENDGPQHYLYKFRNVSRKTVDIRQLIPNCSCVTATPEPRRIGPGEKGFIRLIYRPEGHPGKFLRTVRVYASDGGRAGVAAFLKLEVKVREKQTDKKEE